MKKITTAIIRQMKLDRTPITMLTAYDYQTAQFLDSAGIEMLLVGDSLGNVVLGYESTLPVTMEEILHHVKAVARGAKHALVVADMPFLSYQCSTCEAIKNAGRLLKEAGAQAVKLEGGQEFAATVKAIVAAGIPVVGHLGLTPQSVHQLGGYKVQGKDAESAKKLLADAQALEAAGIFSLVLECVPAPLAKLLSETIQIPTIGIGAGADCDGQVLVINDLLGMSQGAIQPKFVKKYADLNSIITSAAKNYKADVVSRTFPAQEHTFNMSDEELAKLY